MREKYATHTKQSASSIILVQQNDPALVNEVTPPKVASKHCDRMPRNASLNDFWGSAVHIPIFAWRDKLNASTVSGHSNELIALSRGALWKRQVGANQKR